jgi:hypothetical protein
VDEIYRGKQGKFLTVVCNLETGEPLWFGRERKKETLDDFFRSQLVSRQRKQIAAVCVDMWEPFRLSIEQWASSARSCTTSFISCNTPTTRSTRYGERSFSARETEARVDQREEVVADESLDEPDRHPARGIEPAVPVEPAGCSRRTCSKRAWRGCGITATEGPCSIT